MSLETTALPVCADTDDQQLLDWVIKFYHRRLQSHDKAQQFLSDRGLDHDQLPEAFELGFADRQLGKSLPTRDSQEGCELRDRLTKLGIYRPTGHGHFNGSVVLPLRTLDGQIADIYGRKISRNLRDPSTIHTYLPDECRMAGGKRGIFNVQALAASDQIIVTDSVLNALAIWSADLRHVTCTLGLTTLPDELIEALECSGIRRAQLAQRNTPAGNEVAEQIAAQLSNIGIETFRIELPGGQDAGHFVKAGGELQSLVGCTKPRQTVQTKSTETQKSANVQPSHAQAASIEKAGSEKSAHAKPPSNSEVQIDDGQVTFTRGDRHYRIRGLEKNMSSMQLKVNILATRDDLVHLDTLDLVKARSRTSLIKATASELYVDEQTIKKDIGQLLLELEQLRQEQIEAAKKPQDRVPKMTEAERAEAMELLGDPKLLKRIVTDLDHCGMVGEATGKLAGYLAAVSRKLDNPLAVVIQSSSSAGKTSLMDAILAMVPPEEQVKYTGMTGQSLFYLETDSVQHKILAICEQEGVGEAAYALKLLQSEGELRHACVTKNANGRLGTQEYHVQGPVQIFLTTTSSDIDHELANRCLVLTVDESREQTRAIHERQRLAETREGKRAARAAQKIRTLHQNAQRLLRPLEVYNPYAPQLSFTSDKTRLRRDHTKYLALINSLALLHQHQRPALMDDCDGESVEYINVTPRDIATANSIAAEVLGRTLDELSPQTRRFLILVHQFVTERCRELAVTRSDFRFTRRDLREAIGWTDFQVRTHLAKLVELEYVLVHRGRRGRQFVYELVYDGQGREGEAFLMGLIDVAQLTAYDNQFEHERGHFEHGKGQFEPSLSPQRAPIEASSRLPKNGASHAVPSSNGEHGPKRAVKG